MTLSPVLFDMETRSAVDLRVVGSRRYACDPSTQVMTLVCLIEGVFHCWYNPDLGWVKPPILDPARNWPDVPTLDTAASRCRVYSGAQLPDAVRDAVAANREFVAHNCYGFDSLVWNAKLSPVPTIWGDTLPLARSGGMPGALDMIGRVLRGDGKHGGSKILHKWMHRSDKPPAPGDFAEIMKYNVDDVILLQLLYSALDDVSLEADTVDADRVINARGIAVDVATVRAMQEVAIECVARAGVEIERLTRGALLRGDLRKVAKVRQWVQSHGAWLPNLRKETVERFINDPEMFAETLDDSDELRDRVDVPPIVAQVLQLRTAATRITGAKLDSVLASVDADYRLRDMFVFHGAHTGRFTSRKVQLHNLPRPKKGIDAESLLQRSLTYDAIRESIPDALQVDDAVSALLRPMFVARDGYTLCIADFASVECRGVAWIAGEESLLGVFHRGEDPYCWMASKIYGRPVTKSNATERQVGKITVLGAGYQLSEAKFGIYCAMQGIDLSAAGTTASECIGAFRDAFPAIAGYPSGTWQGRKVRRGGLWDQLTATAFAAVNGTPGACGKCKFHMRGRHLITTLPSGRELIYRNARIEDRVPGYCFTLKLEPVMKPTLVYNGPHGENTLYGGKLCWGSETRILTRRGSLRIVDVLPGDEVWDGCEWVATDGCVFNGYKETLSWLGEQVTGDHLIYDGSKWSPVTHLDDRSSRQCLKWAACSVASLSRKVAHLNAVTSRSFRPSSYDDSGRTDTREWFRDAQTRRSTWTESTITGITNREISDASLAPSTLGTVVPVYDLLNCGKRHAYTVLTRHGPVLSHNCENVVQAICRDLLCTGIVKCESRGLPVVLHVHDEIVSEVPDAVAVDGIKRLCQLMSTPPKWADGFPIGVEGYTSRRYFKSPPKGSTEVVALCGKLTKVTTH